MRTLRVPLAVTALAAALTLTACAGKSGDDAKKDPECPIAVEVGPGNAATTAGDTGNIPVTLTNDNTKECTFEGFPGIELNDGKASWAVADEKGTTPQKVTLQKGETATFTITYVRGKAGGSLSAPVKTLKITVPGAGDARSYPWSYGDVTLKDTRTPDASVSPIQVAGD
ncbi:DUF4232 domain-containing protein [Streptomyces colonosanans]|uniref:DUF4232 domain-containing protein n=1 Tax=Streptomyces colonosanans TaxID=1428652 RepID=A0A1S2P7Y2_9ACTN|nr:DUF4232 domain-containing protein [Streptomyces colonosanans]OIJ89706.1 hypothetical protein BIV24_18955 [Streptomyces colonosanans]